MKEEIEKRIAELENLDNERLYQKEQLDVREDLIILKKLYRALYENY